MFDNARESGPFVGIVFDVKMIDAQQFVPPCSCLPRIVSQHRSWADLKV